jgi:hypothetical protein
MWVSSETQILHVDPAIPSGVDALAANGSTQSRDLLLQCDDAGGIASESTAGLSTRDLIGPAVQIAWSR